MEDPISLFLEDMKDSDKNVVVNTMNKLTIVAAAIGPARILSDLIPHLVQMTAIANDEVLASLARQLYYVFDLAGGPSIPADQIQKILDMLKTLAGEEEVVIRQNSVISLSKIIQDLSPAEVLARGFPIFRALVSGEWFAPRVAAASLTPALLAVLPENHHADILALYNTLCTDETPMTRRAAAVVLGDVAKEVAKSMNHSLPAVSARFQTTIYPLLQSLSIDERDHLRELSPVAIAAVVPLVPAADFYHILTPLIAGLQDDHSWRVRTALATAMPDVMLGLLVLAQTHVKQGLATSLQAGGNFDLNGLLTKTFDIYANLLTDSSTEPRAMATLALGNIIRAMFGVAAQKPTRPKFTVDITADDAFDLSDMYLGVPDSKLPSKFAEQEPMAGFTFPGNALFKRLSPALDSLRRDTSVILKQDLLDQLASIANLVGQTPTTDYIVPVFTSLMQDADLAVRASVAENLEPVAEALGATGVVTHILPIMLSLSKDQRWRVRRAVVANLGTMARILGTKGKVYENRLIPLVRVALSEHVHAVRNRACVELRVMTYELGISIIMEKLFPITSELFDTKINYLYRLTALNFCLYTATAYENACPLSIIMESFMPLILAGATDTVPNVRILASRCFLAIMPRLDVAYVHSTVLPALKKLEKDDDKEVALQSLAALKAVPAKD